MIGKEPRARFERIVKNPPDLVSERDVSHAPKLLGGRLARRLKLGGNIREGAPIKSLEDCVVWLIPRSEPSQAQFETGQSQRSPPDRIGVHHQNVRRLGI